MQILEGEAAEACVRSLEGRSAQLDKVGPAAKKIVEDVRRSGDRALLRYARKFDRLGNNNLAVTTGEMRNAWEKAPASLRTALLTAERRIRKFCEWQKPEGWMRTGDGIALGQIVRSLDSVGCYVPGGRFPLVSTLLMTAIPARVAGVENIRVVSPNPSREILAAAGMLGIREFYRIGGAHAIAAFAYGTESIARVDKIVGPGNSYVTAAKKLVSFDCAIDMLAGPTEVVIVSDSGSPGFIAADLMAQAEHDPETLAMFITTSRSLAKAVAGKVMSGRKNEPASHSISTRGAALIARSKRQAFDWANRIAPEHITVEKEGLTQVKNAGSIFIGDYSAQAAGDYASGPNHVLPTAGAARFRGGLSVMDFVKIITVQELSSRGLKKLSTPVVTLAETEGLRAHADSIRVRCAGA